MARIDTRNVARQGNNGTVKEVIEQLADRTASLPEDGSGGAVITEDVTYTVAADGDAAGINDFDSIDEAMAFVIASSPSKYRVTLVLNDGVHSSFNANNLSSTVLTVKSASGDSTLCTITRGVGSSASGFGNNDNCMITLKGITIDPTINGEAVGSWLWAFTAVNSSLWLSKFTAKKMHRGVDLYVASTVVLESTVNIQDCIASGLRMMTQSSAFSSGSLFIDNCVVGVDLVSDGSFIAEEHAGASTVSITNNAEAGVKITGRGIAVLGSTAPTFSGNGVDTNIPLNEIQYNGGYVSDGTSALSFKA